MTQTMKNAVFWHVTPRSVVEIFRPFEGKMVGTLAFLEDGGGTFLRKFRLCKKFSFKFILEKA